MNSFIHFLFSLGKSYQKGPMGYITHLRKIFTYFQYNIQFRYYLPLEKSGVIRMNKLEFPPHKDALYQAWLKLAQLF